MYIRICATSSPALNKSKRAERQFSWNKFFILNEETFLTSEVGASARNSGSSTVAIAAKPAGRMRVGSFAHNPCSPPSQRHGPLLVKDVSHTSWVVKDSQITAATLGSAAERIISPQMKMRAFFMFVSVKAVSIIVLRNH